MAVCAECQVSNTVAAVALMLGCRGGADPGRRQAGLNPAQGTQPHTQDLLLSEVVLSDFWSLEPLLLVGWGAWHGS